MLTLLKERLLDFLFCYVHVRQIIETEPTVLAFIFYFILSYLFLFSLWFSARYDRGIVDYAVQTKSYQRCVDICSNSLSNDNTYIFLNYLNAILVRVK